jgi:hypothetical protein
MSTTITLDDDVALVLFELLASERLESGLEAPERNALWRLDAYLDRSLAQPFAPVMRDTSRKLGHHWSSGSAHEFKAI